MLKERKEIYDYINENKEIYNNLIEFLENNDINDDLENINQIKFISQQIQTHDKFEKLFQLISNIADNSHRDESLFKKIYQIIEYFEKQLKLSFSNINIFHIFESNKKILLFLFKKGIITIDDTIYKELQSKTDPNGNRYCHFFYPEIKNFIGEENSKIIKKELLEKDPNIFDCFEEKREEGENDTFICSLIRKDSVEKFIEYINQRNIPVTSVIPSSIFETNSFLNEKEYITLIKYAVFFGSIQIFQYLVFNKVELKPSLWIYAIHSRNPELIHLLESYKVKPPKDDYEKCFCESIKCHHNELAEYIEINYLPQNNGIKTIYKNEEILSSILKFHNFAYFPFTFEDSNEFYYLASNNYLILVNLFIRMKEELIKKDVYEKINIYLFYNITLNIAANENKTEIIYYLLLNNNLDTIYMEFFLGNKKLKKIVIPFSIHAIYDNAFKGCSSLTHISIPSSVIYIGYNAFEGCSSLKQITIPSSITKIGNSVFSRCSSLKQISIPLSVTSIGEYAFERCSSLAQISIPSSITIIRNSVFSGCTSLKQISIPSSVTSIGKYAFEGCSSLAQISIPSSITKIGNYSFSRCTSLKQISIPSSVTSIGQHAFEGCSSLKQISIPSSITTIGYSTFSGCTSLKQISIPSSVTSIEDNAFNGCSSLAQISIPSSITTIGNSTFSGCSSLQQISIPSSVTSIESYAFFGCSSLTQVSIPSSVTSMGNYVFKNCSSITQISISSSFISNICDIFDQIISIKLIENSEFITNYAFENKAILLRQIILPQTLESIGKYAFKGCISLFEIVIPNSIYKIDDYAFSGCSSLQKITFLSSELIFGEKVFDGVESIEICGEIKNIPDELFYENHSLKQIIISSLVTYIGKYSFAKCSSLIDVFLPPSVNCLHNLAFAECSSMVEIIIPDSVYKIGENVFEKCKLLKKVTLPSSLKDVGNFVFSECISLENVNFPPSVEYIGDCIFDECTSLKTIEIPSSADYDDFGKCPSANIIFI